MGGRSVHLQPGTEEGAGAGAGAGAGEGAGAETGPCSAGGPGQKQYLLCSVLLFSALLCSDMFCS